MVRSRGRLAATWLPSVRLRLRVGRAGRSFSGADGCRVDSASGTPIWRDNWRSIRALRPRGSPVIWLASCVSSMLVPISVPALSIMPLFMVVERMLLTSSCMNRPSSWRAVSLMVL